MRFLIRLVIAAFLIGIIASGGTLSRVLADEPAAADQEKQFELLVVGPDGKPVPKVNVEVRSTPAIAADQVVVGKFVNKSKVTTDENGLLAVKLPKQPKSFQVFITTPGFGPYCARWTPSDTGQAIPAHLTAELEAGWTVGGIVVDSDGNPVKGATVRPSIEFKKPPDDHSQLGSGASVKTDADGKWHFDSVPRSITNLRVAISHPDFKTDDRKLPLAEFAIERDAAPTAKIAMDRGIVVTGKVTDEAGNPIEGAVIRTRFVNDTKTAKTDAEGNYKLSGCQPANARLVISAKGKATDMQDVRLAESNEPVNFMMKPGGTIRVHVVDADGKGVPKSRIFFQKWRGQQIQYFEFDNINQDTDKDGIWEWHEAPLDELQADICPQGGMQLIDRPLIARDEEYVFKKIPELAIVGKVVDAETKEPIKSFRVIPGAQYNPGRMFWGDREAFTASDGKYQVRHTRENFAYAVRIEAEGYLPAISRDVKFDEGQVTVDFALKKGTDLKSIVLMPDGKPAAGAKIALGTADAQIQLQNGDLADSGTYAAQTKTDDLGRFHLTPQTEGFHLLITHPAGFAHVQSVDGSLPEKIQLNPWAKVEGVFRKGQKIVAGAPIEAFVSGIDVSGKGLPNIFSSYETTTDKDGHYEFDRVVPGEGRIGRQIVIMVNDGATEVASSCRIRAEFVAGKTTHLDLGGTGRPMVGTLLPPKNFQGKVPWQFAIVQMQIFAPQVPAPANPQVPANIANDSAKATAWMLQWQQTPEGQIYMAWERGMEASQKARSNGPYITATVDREGKFCIDDVPAGAYSLSVIFQNGNNNNAPGAINDFQVTLPEMDGGRSDEKLDLGAIRLEK